MNRIPIPMLACPVGGKRGGKFYTIEEDLKKIRFPAIASRKEDGIRALMNEEFAGSRSGRPIPNRHIQQQLSMHVPYGFDGEIRTYTVVDGEKVYDDFNTVQSKVMSVEGVHQFDYMVFDLMSSLPYEKRLVELDKAEASMPIIKLAPAFIQSLDDLGAYEEFVLDAGGEGICFRTPSSPYKHGRSTFKEQWLMKLTRKVREEGVVIGFIERMMNTNAPILSPLGYQTRPSDQAGQIYTGLLGVILVRTEQWGVLEIGTGFPKMSLLEANRTMFGKLCTFEYKNYGMKDKPRSATFVGIRSVLDI